MKDKDLAQAIVDWFFENDCTPEKALKAVLKILKEVNHGNSFGNKS
jgi:hypothetical protein